MAASPYRPVWWSDIEPTFTVKLNQMASNDQWLFENSPRMLYSAYGVRRAEGLKIASGTILFPPYTSVVERTAEFGTFFSTACNPIVVVGGAIAPAGVHWPSIRGLGGGQPDHRGFICRVNTTEGAAMGSNFYIPWIAVGF